jgi:hypothetical protein
MAHRLANLACLTRCTAEGALRTVLIVLGLGAGFGVARPAEATHFRYGTINWAPAASPARTIVFQVQNAFRRAPTANETSIVHCINVNTLATQACTGPKACDSGTNIGAACATNATCTGGGSCVNFAGVGDVVREDIALSGSQFFFGDGTHVPAGSTHMFYLVTSIDPANNWFFGQGLDPTSFPTIDTTISHTYAADGTYTAGFDDCCRISSNDPPNGHINNPDFGYRVQATVNGGGGAVSSPGRGCPGTC